MKKINVLMIILSILVLLNITVSIRNVMYNKKLRIIREKLSKSYTVFFSEGMTAFRCDHPFSYYSSKAHAEKELALVGLEPNKTYKIVRQKYGKGFSIIPD